MEAEAADLGGEVGVEAPSREVAAGASTEGRTEGRTEDDGGGLKHAVLVEDEGVGSGDDVAAGAAAGVMVVLELGEEGER